MIILCFGTSGYIGGIQRVQHHIEHVIAKTGRPYRVLGYNTEGSRITRPIRQAWFFLQVFLESLKGQRRFLFGHPALAAVVGKLPVQIRYSVMTHGLELEKVPVPTLMAVFKGAEAVICNSEFSAAMIRDKFELDNLKQVHYPPHVFPEANILKRNAKTARPRLLIVGRMFRSEGYKGHDLLLKCWPEIVKTFPDATLAIVGNGDGLAVLKQLAEEVGVSSNVEFITGLNDVALANEYARAWAFAMPSTGEGQGLVYLEAMQFGLPVIALSETPAAEFVISGENGFLVDSGREQNMVSAIETLFSDQKLLGDMQKKARATYDSFIQNSEFKAVITSVTAP